MKEVYIAKYYIEVLGLSKEGKDGKMLLNYRAPSSAKKDAGDFASVAEVVLKGRCPDQGDKDINLRKKRFKEVLKTLEIWLLNVFKVIFFIFLY